MLRKIGSGLVWLIVFGVALAEDPPAKEPIKAAVAPEAQPMKRAGAPDGDTEDRNERLRLRAKLFEMIRKLEEQRKIGNGDSPPKPKGAAVATKPKAEPTESGASIDSMQVALKLYKAGEIDAALQAFPRPDDKRLAADDHLFVRYMTACCLRKLGRTAEAEAIYSELAQDQGDAVLKEASLWNLSMMKSTKEIESQLEQLRSRRIAR